MSSKSKVYFFFDKVSVTLKNRTRIKEEIELLFKREKTKLEGINYIFCNDEKLLSINRSFLKHDFYTDIITFDLSESAATKGEIYISVDRVRENAINLKLPLYQELRRVIFHGALHLCGYGDNTTAEIEMIRKKEDFYMASLSMHTH
jgi:rRNA maturation RNase YbeY